MKRYTVALLSAFLCLSSTVPAWSQGGRGGGRGGGATARPGGMSRPNRDAGVRNPGAFRGRGERGGGRIGIPGHRHGGRDHTPRTQRHRDGHHGGRPGRHHHFRQRIWWPYFVGGFGYSSFGYGSPFYNPYHAGYYHNPFYDPYYSGFYSSDTFDDADNGPNITFRVKPENARVMVNGLLYSSKGKTSFDLPIGQWTVEISAPGYRTEIINLNVEQGVRYRIERKLEKDPTQDSRGRPLKEELLPSR